MPGVIGPFVDQRPLLAGIGTGTGRIDPSIHPFIHLSIYFQRPIDPFLLPERMHRPRAVEPSRSLLRGVTRSDCPPFHRGSFTNTPLRSQLGITSKRETGQYCVQYVHIWVERGAGLIIMHGRNRIAINPRIRTMPRRSTSRFHRPSRHRGSK